MESTPLKKWFRNPYLWSFMIGIITITGIRPFLRHVPDPPPVIGKIPEFSFIDQDQKKVTHETLRGHVYIANFIFTSCPSICPTLTKAMAKLQEKFQQDNIDIRLVSF